MKINFAVFLTTLSLMVTVRGVKLAEEDQQCLTELSQDDLAQIQAIIEANPDEFAEAYAQVSSEAGAGTESELFFNDAKSLM